MFFFLLFFLIFGPPYSASSPSSPYWTLDGQRNNWQNGGTTGQQRQDNGRGRKSAVVITLGRYSEREGDMLPSTNSRTESAMAAGEREPVRWTIGQSADQHQFVPVPIAAVPLPRPLLLPPPSPPLLLLHDSPRALATFDSSIPRFASAPPPGVSPHRVVLPPDLVQRLRNGISMESYRKNPPRLMGEALGGEGAPTSKSGNGDGRRAGWGRSNGAGGGDETPKTVFLTNDRIAPSAADQRPKTMDEERPKTQGPPEGKNIMEDPPVLPDFRHEDIRPATGDRLGMQAKFSGQTNEYKEDWGKEFTGPEGRWKGAEGGREYFGPKMVTEGEGLASRLVGSGINPAPEGSRIVVEENQRRRGNNNNWGQAMPIQSELVRGRVSPYGGPEEITGSRYRNQDEYFNRLNGGTQGRGPNRFVKMDLLNE